MNKIEIKDNGSMAGDSEPSSRDFFRDSQVVDPPPKRDRLLLRTPAYLPS